MRGVAKPGESTDMDPGSMAQVWVLTLRLDRKETHYAVRSNDALLSRIQFIGCLPTLCKSGITFAVMLTWASFSFSYSSNPLVLAHCSARLGSCHLLYGVEDTCWTWTLPGEPFFNETFVYYIRKERMKERVPIWIHSRGRKGRRKER